MVARKRLTCWIVIDIDGTVITAVLKKQSRCNLQEDVPIPPFGGLARSTQSPW